MAVCEYCNQEMMTADGCTAAPIVIGGRSYPPIRLGQESYPWRMSRCGDCRVRLGEVHHHGCDIEECPACRRQSISCGCRWAGEEDEDEQDDDPDEDDLGDLDEDDFDEDDPDDDDPDEDDPDDDDPDDDVLWRDPVPPGGHFIIVPGGFDPLGPDPSSG